MLIDALHSGAAKCLVALVQSFGVGPLKTHFSLKYVLKTLLRTA